MTQLFRSRSAPARRAALAILAVLAILISGFSNPARVMADTVEPLAEGSATVDVDVAYVSGLDLVTPIDELKATYGSTAPTNRFGLQIGYTCGTSAPCEDVTIKIDPQQLDSTYGHYRFATYDSVTLPAGATISGDNDEGYIVQLGDLPAGYTGSFTMTYNWQSRGTSVAPQSFFIDGEEIVNTVTIDAANAQSEATASDAITWRIDTMSPQVSFANQNLARPGTEFDYVLRMGSDCMWYRSTANHGEPSKLCASEYTNVFELPEGAEFVSATHDGVYDSATNTVTWTDSGMSAATGWGSAGSYGVARTVTVIFPEEMFEDNCVIEAQAAFTANVTYLDGVEKQETAEHSQTLTNCPPFAASAPLVKVTPRDLSPNIVWDNKNNSWYLDVGNKANVPGVAVITDSGLDQIENVRIYEVVATGGTIDYEYSDGTSGREESGTLRVPSGKTLASVTITSPELAGPNLEESDQRQTTTYRAVVRFEVTDDAPPEGWERSNTASAVMTYPGTDLEPHDSGSDTSTILITPRPANFTASISAPGVSGNPVAGVPVEFSVGGTTSYVDEAQQVEPQYMFVAPYLWDIIDDSWGLADGAPEGATFTRKTVIINDEERQALLVEWPDGADWGANSTWPRLHVSATPSNSAPAGSVGRANGMIGDRGNSFPAYSATWGGNSNGQRYVDATDLDGDGVTDEYFASANINLTVGAAAALSTVKEVCLDDEEADDGCDWVTEGAAPIAPDADNIKYRVTLRNNGNTSLNNVVAYDILPHPGDHGVSSANSTIPRGSDFDLALVDSDQISSNLSLQYSDSTDPCRSEVYPAGPADCDDNWGSAADGARSIRAEVQEPLAPGASTSFTYTARVLGAADAGDLACNSVATSAQGLPIAESSPVCVTVAATDLAVEAHPATDLQIGRPGVLEFTVSNVSGSDSDGVVTVKIPAGISVQEFEFDDWTCRADDAFPPVNGPVDLVCETPEQLSAGDAIDMRVPIVPNTGGTVVDVNVTGDLFDPDLDNNSDSIRLDPAPAVAGLFVTKDNARTTVVNGQETTYTITVTNELLFETVDEVVLTDRLPNGVEFISASDGGVANQGEVTWTIPTLAPSESATVEVTVRVPSESALTQITNRVDADALDPGFSTQRLAAFATDTDRVNRLLLTKDVVLLAPGDMAHPRPGDVAEFGFTIANTGGDVLENVTLVDEMSGLSEITYPQEWPTEPKTLHPGESVHAVATYKLTAADIEAGSIFNAASVTALSADEDVVSDDAEVSLPLAGVGGLALSKTAGYDTSGTLHAGDLVEFEFQVTNIGNLPMSNIAIQDDLDGLSEITYKWPSDDRTLAPGDSVTASATYKLTQADIDRGQVHNEASVSGTGGGETFTASDEEDVFIPAVPGASFSKTAVTAADEISAAGDLVEFEFTIENTGNVTLEYFEIIDHLPGVSGISYGDESNTATSLKPGETLTATATYNVLQSDLDAGSLENTATLTAIPSRGSLDPVDGSVTIDFTSNTSLVLTKTAELVDLNGNELADLGEEIQFKFTLENAGNVTLRDVSVADPMVTGLSEVSALAPGETVTITADAYVVTAEDVARGSVTNTAVAAGTTDLGAKVESDPSTATVETGAVEISTDPSEPGDSATGEPTPDDPNGPGSLPRTGANISAGWILAIIGILGLGVWLVSVSRRPNKS